MILYFIKNISDSLDNIFSSTPLKELALNSILGFFNQAFNFAARIYLYIIELY